MPVSAPIKVLDQTDTMASPELGNSGDRLVLGPVLFLHHFGTTGSSERFVPDLILHWDRTSTNDGLDGLIPLSNIDSSLCPC